MLDTSGAGSHRSGETGSFSRSPHPHQQPPFKARGGGGIAGAPSRFGHGPLGTIDDSNSNVMVDNASKDLVIGWTRSLSWRTVLTEARARLIMMTGQPARRRSRQRRPTSKPHSSDHRSGKEVSARRMHQGSRSGVCPHLGQRCPAAFTCANGIQRELLRPS